MKKKLLIRRRKKRTKEKPEVMTTPDRKVRFDVDYGGSIIKRTDK